MTSSGWRSSSVAETPRLLNRVTPPLLEPQREKQRLKTKSWVNRGRKCKDNWKRGRGHLRVYMEERQGWKLKRFSLIAEKRKHPTTCLSNRRTAASESVDTAIAAAAAAVQTGYRLQHCLTTGASSATTHMLVRFFRIPLTNSPYAYSTAPEAFRLLTSTDVTSTPTYTHMYQFSFVA